MVIENGLWCSVALCVETGKVMILFLVLASHVKYMAGNLFSVWPGRNEDLESRRE